MSIVTVVTSTVLQGTYRTAIRFLTWGQGPILVHYTVLIERRPMAVDLTVKLNVLAVCMAFAFVGAILVGAF